MYLNILLHIYKNYSTIEQFIMGGLTGLATTIFIALVIRINNRKKAKEDEKLIEEEYIQILKTIVIESKQVFTLNPCNLLKELQNHCNPSNYLDPYDSQKADVASKIYSELQKYSPNKCNYFHLSNIRAQAENKLNIKIDYLDLYTHLLNIFNPKHFVNSNFSEQKFKCANRAYQYIISNKDNIQKLEEFAIRIDLLRINNIKLTILEDIDDLRIGSIVHVLEYPFIFKGKYNGNIHLAQINNNDKYLCRVNKQVQNYRKYLKNSSIGERKFSFSLGRLFIFA